MYLAMRAGSKYCYPLLPNGGWLWHPPAQTLGFTVAKAGDFMLKRRFHTALACPHLFPPLHRPAAHRLVESGGQPLARTLGDTTTDDAIYDCRFTILAGGFAETFQSYPGQNHQRWRIRTGV